MNVKLRELLDGLEWLRKLGDATLEPQAALRLARLIRKVDEALLDVQKEREKILSGDQSETKLSKEASARLNALMDSYIELPDVRLSFDDVSGTSVTANMLAKLSWLIDTEEPPPPPVPRLRSKKRK